MVQVRVDSGLLEGDEVNNEIAGIYFSFKGIPYAAPPIGDLRFKAPQPLTPWEGIRNAKEFGPACYQQDALSNLTTGSEDCLYINVYCPNLTPKIPLPVMVWIHGGAFIWGCGSDDMYGPELLVSSGVILVSFNYRLGALGLLCLDTEDVPGNAGMKDQVAALRWVKRNIGNFGGDPENITIFGISAGGASVGFHLVSPMSKGLFKRAIVQSGAALNWWAQAFEPREQAIKLAKQLGCDSEDDQVLSEFFKTVPVENLINLKLPITLGPKLYGIQFAVADEKQFGDNERFFYGDVVNALKENIHEGVDIMTGYTNDEGLMAVIDNLDNVIAESENYLEFFVPQIVRFNCPMKKQLEVGRQMKKFYIGNGKITENMNQLYKFLAFDMFAYEVILAGKLCASTENNKVYLYKFTCHTERHIYSLLGLKDIVGDRKVTCHADDVTYLFSNKIPDQQMDTNTETFKIVSRVVKLWTNFAKYGNPTPDDSLGVKWLPYTLESQSYLDVGNQLTTGVAPDAGEVQFWDNIFKEFYPHYTVNV